MSNNERDSLKKIPQRASYIETLYILCLIDFWVAA